jgi:hypothetical protein
MHVTIFVDPSRNGVQHELNRWIMLFAGITVGHAALHRGDENNPFWHRLQKITLR